MLARRGALLVSAALVLGVVVVYAPVRSFEFISFDDPQYVTDNPVVEAGLTAAGFVWAFGPRMANWHPLTWLSHMLDVELFGLDAGGHHVTNVLLHAANVLLLLAVLQTMTGRLGRSAFVATVFALHPLRVESVAWVSERKDVLSTCFWMLTLLAYVRWVRRPGSGRYALVLLALALGLAAKPMLVSLPCVLLLLDWWPLRRLQGRDIVRRVVEKLPLFALASLAAVATVYAQRSFGAVVALDKIPPSARVANAAVSYWRYVGATLWPTGLAIFYPYRPWPAVVAWSAGAGLVGASTLAVLAARRYPWVLVGWLWWVVTLIPVIGLVQVGSQAMADRFTYVPQVGLSIIAAWGAAEALRDWRHRDVVLGVTTVGVGLVCALVSARQVRYWRNTETLFEHALAVTRDNYQAHLSLGEALARQGRFDAARSHYFEALRLNPASAAVQLNVGNVYAREGQPERAEAHYREALRLKPDLPDAHNSLGLLLARSGRIEPAMDHYRQALATRPHYPQAHVNLGDAMRTLGQFDAATGEYREALRRQPDWSEAHYGLAVSLGSLGDLAGAEREYRETLRLDPGLAEAHFGLGLVLEARGTTADAIAELRAALRLQPELTVAAEALAWVLATADEQSPDDGREAVGLAEAARKAAGEDNARLLDTLGAAYAASGRFAEAAAVARQAARLAREGGDERFAGDVERRLALYETGRPVRSGVREVPR